MTEKNEALRLADWLNVRACGGDNWNAKMNAAAAELRRLHADAEESEALRERLSALLTSTAIALRGPAPELVSWSWHDLPERAAALVAQRDALLAALKGLVAWADDLRRKDPVEPVAWRWRLRSPTDAPGFAQPWTVTTYYPREQANEIEPLYAAPPQRKPLTEEGIAKCWHNTP